MSRKSVTIIGAGRVGRRAAEVLVRLGFDRIAAVEPDPGALAGLDPAIEPIQGEGVQWLSGDKGSEKFGEWIIPALPLHLAYEWLLAALKPGAHRAAGPARALEGLPGLSEAADKGFVISKARGICPPECDERKGCSWSPAGSEPLPETLSRRAENWPLEIIRSRPLAPGLGGYPRSELDRLLKKTRSRQGRVMVATACRWHAVIHELELNQGGDNAIQV